jgi:hypothetical protein
MAVSFTVILLQAAAPPAREQPPSTGDSLSPFLWIAAFALILLFAIYTRQRERQNRERHREDLADRRARRRRIRGF